MEILKKIKSAIPFELKRSSSIFSIIIALLIVGFISKAGEFLFDNLIKTINPFWPAIGKYIILIFSYQVKINVIGLIIFIFLLFPIYRLIDKKILNKISQEIIFFDNFRNGNKGWQLNYWGSNNPNKTNRIENGSMIFEATNQDWNTQNNENGAYFDLKNGIYADNKYEISCKVRAKKSTNMQFILWLHDTSGNANIKYPSAFITPTEKSQIIKGQFIGTQTNALRIHLHNKAGNGEIIIEEIKVVKI